MSWSNGKCSFTSKIFYGQRNRISLQLTYSEAVVSRCEKLVLRCFANFTRKHLQWCLFLVQLQFNEENILQVLHICEEEDSPNFYKNL